MKDKLTFPSFTHDSIAGYCNDKPLWAQYKNDKKSKYIGTKEFWQELSNTQQALDVAVDALKQNLSQAKFTQMLDASRFHVIRTKCEYTLDQIKQITETKEVK